ncbi:hypothetical protein Q7P37_011288 [Cladosporium fusiforme]
MYRLSRAHPLRQQIALRPHVRPNSRIQARNFWKRANGVQQNVQRVRMKSPLFTWKTCVTWFLYGTVTYAYVQFFMRHVDIQIEEIEEDTQEQPIARKADHEGEWEEQEEGDEDEYAEEDSTFIPMTWATKLPRSFYKGSDPEWRAFVKFAKDKPRHKKIQDELVQMVYGGAQRHPRVGTQIGKDMKIGRYWLEIQFPDGPPQEYVRSGLEIGDDFIAWSPQRISPESHYRLNRALWPKATFDGLWATTKLFTGIHFRRLKQALGWEEVNPFSPEERFKLAIETMEKQKAGRGGSSVSEKARTSPDGSPGSLVSASSAASEAQSSPKASEDRIPLPWQIPLPLPSSDDLVSPMDFQIAKHVFLGEVMKQWNPKKLEPPRGSFVVQGLVEIKGSKGKMMFDVQSCYDPKEHKYVVVNAGVRSVKQWNQKPKGGN